MNLSQLIAKNKAVEPEAQQALPEGDSEKPKPKLGGLAGKLGAKKSTAPQGIKLGNLPATPKPKEKPVESVSDDMDLSALAGLDVSGIESLDEPTERSQFPDEIEATAPARELPADLTAQQLQFVESLDVIYTVLHDADMLGQSIRSVMQELQENKEFIQLVSDHDIHTMIKAIRNVMGVAKIRKEEKSSKRKTGGAKRTASSKFDADTLSQLDAMMANSKAFDDD